jgi:hypothetical protein
MSLAKLAEKLAADLAWRGPGGRPLGHILLTRAEAELILAALGRLQMIAHSDKLAGSANTERTKHHDDQEQDTT